MMREKFKPFNKDQEKIEPGNEEKNDFEKHLEDLLSNYRRINEGQEGIIALVDLSQYSDETLKEFFGDDILQEIGNNDRRLAVKMLKVYGTSYRAIEEGNLQRKGRESLLEDGINDVTIPRVYYSNELKITSPKLRKALESENIELTDNKVGILLMDLLPGDDIETHLFKEVVKRHPDLEEFRQNLEGMPRENLVSLVITSLGLNELTGHEDLYTHRKKTVENMKILVNFLSRKDYVLNPKIISGIEKGIDSLHHHHVYHRDLHGRNVMISDEGATEPKVFIIDFGKSLETTETSLEDIYSDNGEDVYINDKFLVNALKPLTKHREQDEREKFFSLLERPLGTVKGSTKLSQPYEDLTKILGSQIERLMIQKTHAKVIEKIEKLIGDFSDSVFKDTFSEENFNLRLSLWNELKNNYPEALPHILSYLQTLDQKNSKRSPYIQNQVKHLIDYMRKDIEQENIHTKVG